jgi:hypothetical protein
MRQQTSVLNIGKLAADFNSKPGKRLTAVDASAGATRKMKANKNKHFE